MPAIRFIILAFEVRKLMTAEPLVADTREKIISGKPIPAPKAMKLVIPLKNPDVETVALVNRAMMNAGLHGITIAPKKKPKEKALAKGFFRKGTFAFGITLLKSKLKIKKTLTTRRIANAIGETIRMTPVNDWRRNKVKMTPKRSMKRTTPAVTTTPTKARVLRLSFLLESCEEM